MQFILEIQAQGHVARSIEIATKECSKQQHKAVL